MTELTHYLTADGYDPFQAWLDATKAKDRQATMRVLTRLNRLAAGNAGDTKTVGDGVWELRITYGPGYRVYYAKVGARLVMLLIGGTKQRQQSDIEQAKAFLADHKRRARHEKS
ncbi:type II toxin-antitoxin system RelE/ParE family toxin [Vreelandella zhanjiangensis]|uniref:type II toxin-antitoxin system RelE/ParE family toxin n=1 Tax=Vreelandella zhanjiangensis TaxID=1121960 RepID=UPI00035D5BD3|nr:type II toxin-antitoxin system RelE/ParE family toxin [Halomonas zhanjiangensis]